MIGFVYPPDAENWDDDADSGTPAWPDRWVSGGSFVFDAADSVPAIWGHDGDVVLWSEGEPLIITGPPGVGKTTLTGQVVRGRLGLLDKVIGYPVRSGKRRLLYLAMDRPAQISRSLKRQFRHDSREMLDEWLLVWKGPPPTTVPISR
ncbi:MAG: nucleoside-triphosphatase [Actinobacteria bacterium]|nr:nucleoside-triphosphatase [Actinomycetota bacterium]